MKRWKEYLAYKETLVDQIIMLEQEYPKYPDVRMANRDAISMLAVETLEHEIANWFPEKMAEKIETKPVVAVEEKPAAPAKLDKK